MKSGREIEGVTTAAGIRVVGTAGIAGVMGAYGLALSTTVLAALILVIVARIELETRRWRSPDPLAGDQEDVTEKGLSRPID